VMDPCEFGDEPSGSTNSDEFIDQLTNRWPFKKDSAPQISLVAGTPVLIRVQERGLCAL
jgi:hypothetical protein